MKTGWRIILTIVVLAILLGSICFGVGLLTGGNPDFVKQAIDEFWQLVEPHVAKLHDTVSGIIGQVLHLPG